MEELKKLPHGKRCADCLYCKRCRRLFGNDDTNDYCQFSNSRFVLYSKDVFDEFITYIGKQALILPPDVKINAAKQIVAIAKDKILFCLDKQGNIEKIKLLELVSKEIHSKDTLEYFMFNELKTFLTSF